MRNELVDCKNCLVYWVSIYITLVVTNLPSSLESSSSRGWVGKTTFQGPTSPVHPGLPSQHGCFRFLRGRSTTFSLRFAQIFFSCMLPDFLRWLLVFMECMVCGLVPVYSLKHPSLKLILIQKYVAKLLQTNHSLSLCSVFLSSLECLFTLELWGLRFSCKLVLILERVLTLYLLINSLLEPSRSYLESGLDSISGLLCLVNSSVASLGVVDSWVIDPNILGLRSSRYSWFAETK